MPDTVMGTSARMTVIPPTLELPFNIMDNKSY